MLDIFQEAKLPEPFESVPGAPPTRGHMRGKTCTVYTWRSGKLDFVVNVFDEKPYENWMFRRIALIHPCHVYGNDVRRGDGGACSETTFEHFAEAFLNYQSVYLKTREPKERELEEALGALDRGDYKGPISVADHHAIHVARYCVEYDFSLEPLIHHPWEFEDIERDPEVLGGLAKAGWDPTPVLAYLKQHIDAIESAVPGRVASYWDEINQSV